MGTGTRKVGWWAFWKRKIFSLIYILGFVLAVAGSIQVYASPDKNLWENITNVFYSVIKLYIFAPTAGVEGSQPLAYELAVWITPISTLLGFLKVGERFFARGKQWLQHVNRRHLIVIGDPTLAVAFMNQALAEDPKESILYAVPDKVSPDEYLHLEKKGIRVVHLDFELPHSADNYMILRQYRVFDAVGLVCFMDEPKNFGRLNAVNEMLTGYTDKRIPTYVMSSDEQMKALIADQADEWERLSVHYFNLYTLRALSLFQNPNFAIHETAGLTADWTPADIRSESTIAAKIGHVHLLIVGFGQLGQAIFREATNLATVNIHQRLHITIVDRNATEKFDFFESDIDQLAKVCRVDLLDLDVQAKALPEALAKVVTDDLITSVVFCLDDAKRSLITADRFQYIWPGAQIAVYTDTPAEIQALLDAVERKRGQLIHFGEDSSILTRDVILRDSLMSQAKAFNAYYNTVAADLMGWPTPAESPSEQWEKLSSFKKESSIAQSLHSPVKRAILERLTTLPKYPSTLGELVEEWKTELDGLSVSEQVDQIEKDPVKNFLTELEHRRWNNFHYMRNFHYSEVKDIPNKCHDCLIDDWFEFLAGDQRDKAIYDFLSVLSITD